MKTPILSLSLLLAAAVSPVHAQQWTLRQCIEHAIEHNISVRQQQISVENSKVQLSTARNQRLPSLNAGAGQNFSFGRGITADNTYTNRSTSSTSVNLSTDVPLWDGGQMEANLRQSKLNLQASLADLEKAREDIALQVTSTYLNVLYQRELLDVQQQQEALSKEQTARLRSLFRNGKKAESDVAQAEATEASDHLATVRQQSQLDLALLDLSQLLELPTPAGFDIVNPGEDPSAQSLMAAEAVYAEAAAIRPEIEAERIRLDAARENIKIARSRYFPQISLSAGMGTNYYKTSGLRADNFSNQFSNNFSQNIGVNLSIPIFNRFTTRNSVRQARLQASNQELNLEKASKTLYKEIQQAYHNAVEANTQYAAAQTAQSAAATSLHLMQTKFENGKATATEYEEARTRHLRTISEALQAKYTALFRAKILNFYRGQSLY